MQTKFRVKLKTKTKLHIFLGLLFISCTITAIGMYFFKLPVQERVFGSFFQTEITKVGHYQRPLYLALSKRQGKTVRIRSYRRLKVGENVCVGVLKKEESGEQVGYYVVDDKDCDK